MPTFCKYLTCPPSSEVEYEFEIEGYAVYLVSLRFPPGSHGLLEVKFLYGHLQVFPQRSDQSFQGDNEVINSYEWWVLPEQPTRLKVKLINNDSKYEHGVIVRIHTLPSEARYIIRVFYAISRTILRFWYRPRVRR